MKTINKQTPILKGLTLSLSALLVLFISSGSARAALQAYVTNDKNAAKNEPPAGNDGNGGNRWLAVGNAGRGTTVNPNETVWIACRNSYNKDLSKIWEVKLTSTGLPTDVRGDNLICGDADKVGFDNIGGKITPWAMGDSFDKNKGLRAFHMEFKPQPMWERIALKNITQIPITFTVQTTHSGCLDGEVSANTLRVPTCYFGAVGPGVMLTNQLITEVWMFPQTIALDSSVIPTFSAPTNSGNWFGFPVYNDPDGNPCPLGGILYQTDGPGLDPSQACGFSFAMQGPAADLQYTMYAYDDVLAEYQDFHLDLRPSLSISTSNNAVALQFNSVLGLNYILESSTDLVSWTPLQSFPGTGGYVNEFSPMNGPVGLFRLRCLPAAISNAAPRLSGISADASSNTITLTFSEPVDPLTATDLSNYYLGSGSGSIDIVNIEQLWPRALELTLDIPLFPNTNYFIGVQGVRDLAGNVMAPITLPFTAATVQDPCPGGTLLVKQAYSECNTDGFWHVVEDDWYRCPDGSTQKFRVSDEKTTQPCRGGQAAPSPAGLLYPKEADVAGTCQSPVLIGQVKVVECVGGLWSVSTYLLYQCLDGIKYLSGPIQNVPMNPPTPCDQPRPPLPPGP